MKKIITIAAAAAALMSLSSCDSILDTFKNEPIFAPCASTVYNGQSVVLKRMAGCSYTWSTDRPDICTITVGEDSVAVASFYCSKYSEENKDIEITIKAVNTLHPEKFKEEVVNLHWWTPKIVKDNGEEMDAELKTGVDYLIYPVDMVTDTRIPVAIYNIVLDKDKKSEEVFEWGMCDESYNSSQYAECEIIERTNTSLRFRFTYLGADQYDIKCTLGKFTTVGSMYAVPGSI